MALPGAVKKQKDKKKEEVNEKKEEFGVSAKNVMSKKEIEKNPKLAEKNGRFQCILQCTGNCKRTKGLRAVKYFSDIEHHLFGYIPICKDCMNKFVLDKNGDVVLEKVDLLLRIIDMCFWEDIYEKALKSYYETSGEKDYGFMGLYIRYLYMSSKEHELFGYINGQYPIIEEMFEDDTLDEEEAQVLEEIKDFWGAGFTIDEYRILEKKYAEWLNSTDSDKLSTRKMIKLICMKELEIEKLRAEGRPTGKAEKELMDLMNTANLTPKTMSALNESESTKVFGVWLRDIEKCRPAEYFEDKSIYKDFDNIQSYFE
ncbi:MAG: hypothetical protein J6A15_00275, partial [Clostridia bacterium]|nr:hypothetical protein [Clostridia bacterium]